MNETKLNRYAIPASIVIASVIISGTLFYKNVNKTAQTSSTKGLNTETNRQTSTLVESVIPPDGIVLPVVWGDLGSKLMSVGAIDEEKFRGLYAQRGVLTDEQERLLSGQNDDKLTITPENAPYLLNLFWALGLASNNPILDTGEMMTVTNGDASGFASTGGWTMSEGSPMDHYSAHRFFELTSDQQALVDKVSQGIYRPCCGNSTHFPDCNHGIAMLGLLELTASQGASEEEMFKAALAVNSYWFPDTYVTIATYMESKGIAWSDASPAEMLSAQYSSGSGFARIKSQVTQPSSSAGGSGCSV